LNHEDNHRVLLWLPGFGKAVARLQFVCLSVFWQVQLAGVGDMFYALCLDSSMGACCTSWRLACLACSWAYAQLYMLIFNMTGSWVGWTVWDMPFRLLLPQIVYASTVLEVCVVAIAVFARLVACKWAESHNQLMLPGADLRTACQLWLWFCVALTAPYIMVLGYKGPLLALLAVMQASCVCVLIGMNDAASAFASQASSNCLPSTAVAGNPDVCCCPGSSLVRSAQQPLPQLQHSCRLSPGNSMNAVIGAGCWSMMSMQLFFCSGHFCEFSGLQYASAFIGFDSMVWYTSGSLLLLNTCGSFLIGCVTLPLLSMAVQLNQYGRRECRMQLEAMPNAGQEHQESNNAAPMPDAAAHLWYASNELHALCCTGGLHVERSSAAAAHTFVGHLCPQTCI